VESDYVNRDSTGWTELRVHGVSGTPPTEMLQHPQVTRVAGDDAAGFYRRSWEDRSVSHDTAQERLEAYSWGGLTAGSGQRALWLLLTPFLLVNVAFWALPIRVDVEAPKRWFGRGVQRLTEAVLRLFALSITLTLVLAAISVSMNLFGWQCVRPTWSCSQRYSWLGFLNTLGRPGLRVAVTAAGPLAVVLLLWWLARKTWAGLEATPVEPAAPEDIRTPLEDRSIWNGVGPVRKLRAVHVTAAIATIDFFLVAPLVRAGADRATVAATVAILVLLAFSAILACLPGMTRRDAPSAHPAIAWFDIYTVLPWLAFAGTFGSAWLVARAGAPVPAATDAGSELPWFHWAVEGLFSAQSVLLIIATLLVAALARWRAKAEKLESATGRAGRDAVAKPIWGGLGAVVLMLASFLLAGGFAAGLGLRVADLLGTPAPAPDPTRVHVMVLPYGYFWAAVAATVVAAAAVVLVLIAVATMPATTRRMYREHVKATYTEPPLPLTMISVRGQLGAARECLLRGRQIARDWAWATVSTVGERLIGIFVLFTVVVLVGGVAGFVRDRAWVYEHLRPMVAVGTFIVGGFVIATLYVGVQAYRNPGFRRTVGILWDLGTFWPRAVHPLAPPCYAERTVPDLIHRIGYLTRSGKVVLSCHSQGTVIGAAVVLQMTYEQSANVALVTYGSPLRTLYARIFPAYFGRTALLRIGQCLVKNSTSALASRGRWPWRNLYRPSDPIGGAVLVDYPATDVQLDDGTGPTLADNGDVDRRIIDPKFARLDGDPTYPPTYAHSDYFIDPGFDASILVVRALREATPASG
jgi:hypothetical protein